jgi:hypothetical protein
MGVVTGAAGATGGNGSSTRSVPFELHPVSAMPARIRAKVDALINVKRGEVMVFL